MEKVTRFGISLPIGILTEFDRIIKNKGYSNRSKAILDLVRDYIKRETTPQSEILVLGIRYNHRQIKNISEIENSYPCTVTSSFNQHLDLNNSFKIVTLSGEPEKIERIKAKYSSLGSDLQLTDMTAG
jgi:CopG family transcriptional regulator, nickel-responsive regulator